MGNIFQPVWIAWVDLLVHVGSQNSAGKCAVPPVAAMASCTSPGSNLTVQPGLAICFFGEDALK